MFTHKISYTFNGGGPSIDKDVSKTSGQEVNVSEAIPDQATDQLVSYAVDFSQMKSLFIVADKDCLLETNNGAAPDDTITLLANIPYVWQDGIGQANPFASADVTALYATDNGSAGADVNLEIRTLVDPTL